MKICSKCQSLKPDSDFTKGLWCRDCRLEHYRVWYLNHKQERHQKYLKEKKQRGEYGKQYREDHKAKIKIYDHKRYLEGKKSGIWQGPTAKYQRKRRRSNPSMRFNDNLRRAVSRGLTDPTLKSSKRLELLPFTISSLKKHLQKQFKPGMTWDNYGKWHIDHIIPLRAFNFSNPNHIDFKKCWALKNLQPLWSEENFQKNRTLKRFFQPSLAF